MRSLFSRFAPLSLVTALSALLTVATLTVLLAVSYDPSIGHFGSELLEGLWFFLLFAVLALLALTARCSPPLSVAVPSSTPTDRTVSLLSGIALVAVGLIAFANVFSAADPIVQVLVSLSSLAALVQGGIFLFSGILTRSAASFAPLSLFFVFYGMALYFRPLPVMNDPLKITVMMTAAALSLLFLLIERGRTHTPLPRLLAFVGSAAAVLSVTAALPLAVYLTVTGSATPEILSFLILVLVFGIGIFVRLFFPAPSLEVSHEDNSGC